MSALNVLCAQLTRDLFAIAKFLLCLFSMFGVLSRAKDGYCDSCRSLDLVPAGECSSRTNFDCFVSSLLNSHHKLPSPHHNSRSVTHWNCDRKHTIHDGRSKSSYPGPVKHEYAYHILSFSTVSCNWYAALGPALLSKPFAVRITSSSSVNLRPLKNSFSFGKK